MGLTRQLMESSDRKSLQGGSQQTATIGPESLGRSERDRPLYCRKTRQDSAAGGQSPAERGRNDVANCRRAKPSLGGICLQFDLREYEGYAK